MSKEIRVPSTCTTRLMLTMVLNLYQELSTKYGFEKSLQVYNASAIAQSGVFNNASQHWNHMQFWEMIVRSDWCQVNWHQLLIALGL